MDTNSWLNVLHFITAQTASTTGNSSSLISGEDYKIIFACISAAITMGLVGVAAALSEGYAAAKACEGIARNPESSGPVTRTMIIGQAVTESVAIYALVIAIIILFLMV
ncbi:MAG TPA: ATP synthase F0 subunit C [Candidatus Hydrogenedens sp.]|nr:ATP synthase F0 subunit C [Candidatus Hydrogenedens sp.]HOK08676.1 ATP synthase F0 subunit C [Candidatus Hydrogenedens sp.]HOL21007.1 ATP synthase F0 subunit C [Candidatus Hydrogenedens sp.]HPP58283.1 ATP synthase F0 subunit C [Candidatus Hydrogenedens sp.]